MSIIPDQISGPQILAVPRRLNQDVVVNNSLNPSGTFTYDVDVAGSDWLAVEGSLTGSAIGDLAISVQPFLGDNVTLSAVVLAPSTTPPPNVVSGPNVFATSQYDVRGYGRVRIIWQNKNASTQTLNQASWHLENWT
jgi:hypothetical protein